MELKQCASINKCNMYLLILRENISKLGDRCEEVPLPWMHAQWPNHVKLSMNVCTMVKPHKIVHTCLIDCACDRFVCGCRSRIFYCVSLRVVSERAIQYQQMVTEQSGDRLVLRRDTLLVINVKISLPMSKLPGGDRSHRQILRGRSTASCKDVYSRKK